MISSFKSSGEYDRSSFVEWRQKYERMKTKDVHMPGGDDLNLNRMPADDLNLNRMPDDDLNLNRMPADDLNLDRMPADDLNLNRMPTDDLNMNRMPADDLNLNRMPTDDLNLDRMPPSDLPTAPSDLPTFPDNLNLNRMPPSDLPVVPPTNFHPFSDASPPDIPVTPSSDLQRPTAPAGETYTQPSPTCPDFIKNPNFVPKCPKVHDLKKEKHSPDSVPSLPKVSPLSQSVTDYTSVHSSTMPSPPIVNSTHSYDPSSAFARNNSNSVPTAPSVSFPGPPSLPNCAASQGTPAMASPAPVPMPGNGFYSPQSSVQAPLNSGTHLSNVDIQTCVNKLSTISANLSHYVDVTRDHDV